MCHIWILNDKSKAINLTIAQNSVYPLKILPDSDELNLV